MCLPNLRVQTRYFRKKTRFLGAYASSTKHAREAECVYQIYGYKLGIFVKKPGFWEPMRLRQSTLAKPNVFTKSTGTNEVFS
jgi:hypothetical protein